MEIKFTTQQVLKVLEVISWIIFIGLCVEAGAVLTNTIITLFIHPPAVKNYWEEPGYLSSLHAFDRGHFIAVTLIMIIIAVLKASLFYVIIKQFALKKLNLSQPFKLELKQFLFQLSCLSFATGLFCYYGLRYVQWLQEQGVPYADMQALRLTGADVWLFMAVILFVIVQIIKRGIEMQSENELTI